MPIGSTRLWLVGVVVSLGVGLSLQGCGENATSPPALHHAFSMVYDATGNLYLAGDPAELNSPCGNLWIADTYNSTIRKVNWPPF